MSSSNQLEFESEPVKLNPLPSETARPNLLENTTYLQAVLDSMLDGIVTCDETGTIRSFNRTAEKIFGYSAAEVIGQNIKLVVPFLPHQGEQDSDISSYTRNRKNSLVGADCETQGQHKDGSLFPMQLAVNEIQLDGQYLFTTICRDITKRKQTEEELRWSEKRFRDLASTSPDFIYIIDLIAQNAIYFNRENLLDYTLTELQHPEAILNGVHPDDKTAVINHWLQMLKGEFSTLEYRLQRKDGQWEWVQGRETIFARDNEGRATQVLVTLSIITESKLAQEALSQSEERYRRIIETSLEGVWLIDSNGHTNLANQRMAEMLGYSLSEMSGMSLFAFMDDEGKAIAEANLERRRQGIDDQHDFKFRCKDGSELWAMVSTNSIFDAQGQYVGALAMVTDIGWRKRAETALQKSNEELEIRVQARTTELKQAYDKLLVEISERSRVEEDLRDSNRRIVNIVESITDGFFALDNQWRFTYINLQAERLLQHHREELLGKNVWDEFPEVAKLIFLDNPKLMEDVTASYGGESFYPRLNTWFEVNAYPYQEGLSVYFRDITGRKQAEEEIHNALAKEKELHELKTRFITLTSHEFRTPLTSILTASELLQYHNQKLSESKKTELLQRIQASVSQMTELLNNVLIMGRAEAGKLGFAPAPLDLVKFCTDLVEELELGSGTRHHISFTNAAHVTTLKLDEKLLRHILSNLLSNAIKYSPSGSIIDFRLSQNDDEIVIQVKDKGIGIPLEDRPRLFELFHRGKNVGTISGTGLGMAIVKRSVDLHQGKIKVDSTPGEGSTFIVMLPLEPVL